MLDLIIVGMGPAGLNAGIYAKRSGLNVLLLDGAMPGGLLNKISIIDNYLGFDSISGPELSEKMINHINKEEVPYKIERVVNVIKNNDIFDVITNKNTYQSKSVIIAIGRKQRKTGILNEDKYFGKGISYCAICDAPLYKNKKLVVIGGGNSAFEESVYLSKYSDDITILVRSSISADDVLVKDVREKNIKIIENAKIEEFYGDEVLKGVKLENMDIECDGAFIYIGYEADTSFLKNLDIVDEYGYIIVDEKMRTKEDGIYACGDIIRKDLYQICTAVSDGSIAAISAFKDIKKKK